MSAGATTPAFCMMLVPCALCPLNQVSSRLVRKNNVAMTAVERLRKLAAPLDPNRLPAYPLPNAAPTSAPLPCCNNTSPITPAAASTWTSHTIDSIMKRKPLLCPALVLALKGSTDGQELLGFEG